MGFNDLDIIHRVLSGERQAFGELVARYNQQLYRTAWSIVRDKAMAEDVLHHSYLNALAHLDQFQGRSAFSTWMTQIVLREAMRQKNMQNPPWLNEEVEFENSEKVVQTPADSAEIGEVSRLLESAIGNLHESYRTVFIMREINGYSVSEVAAALEMTEALVKVRMHRAKNLLRTELSQNLPMDGADAFSFLGKDCQNLHNRVMSQILSTS